MDTKQSAFIKSDQMAAALRRRFAEHHVYLLDLLASPGSGKTSTILATIEALRDEFNIAVVESDKASNADVERIKRRASRPCGLTWTARVSWTPKRSVVPSMSWIWPALTW